MEYISYDKAIFQSNTENISSQLLHRDNCEFALESALDLVTFNIFLLQMNIFHTTGNKFYLQKLKSMPKNAIW